MLDLSLFPTKEEWGTGDEAMDNKLSIALKKSLANLSFESISEFYLLGAALKPRTVNPSFLVTIELVTKALFHLLDPAACIDLTFKKMKGQYYSKEKVLFNFLERDIVLRELKATRKYRYNNQIDFSINLQDPAERNPFVRGELKRSTIDLSVKIIFKDFKSYLSEETKVELFTDPLFLALRGGSRVLLIENFAEIWYHQDQIFSLSLIN
ncbi:MAG: hypothetical protein H7281_08155 [Bacteriovorax sp.]|nr:hypothetical protein [Bacteriovorax sp.]